MLRPSLLLLVCAVACGEAGNAPAPPAGPPPAVIEAVRVAPAAMRDEVELVGQLEAEESVVLRPEIDGVVDEIAFREGEQVAVGRLLVRLRDDQEQAELAEARAERQLAERNYERARTLGQEGVLAAADLDRLLAARDAARARADRAAVALERTRVRAPFAGVLGRRQVSPGDRVTHEVPLVQLDAIDRLKLVFTVPEIAVALLRVGQPLAVLVAPWPAERFHGEVYFVAPGLDPESRRLLAKAYVANADHRLRPGLFANVLVEAAQRAGALAVPESALVQDAEGTWVWRVGADRTAERVAVETGLRSGGRVEITRGLAAGDLVVSAGTHKVAPGMPLEVAPAEGAEPAAP